MVVRAYAVCIGVTPECRRMESEMIGDGRGCADEADEVYHDNYDTHDKELLAIFKAFKNW